MRLTKSRDRRAVKASLAGSEGLGWKITVVEG
jgi:hypothetical protein